MYVLNLFYRDHFISATWVLMYWEEEQSTSVHPEHELDLTEMNRANGLVAGNCCKVKFSKTFYSGRIAAIGTYVLGRCVIKILKCARLIINPSNDNV